MALHRGFQGIQAKYRIVLRPSSFRSTFSRFDICRIKTSSVALSLLLSEHVRNLQSAGGR